MLVLRIITLSALTLLTAAQATTYSLTPAEVCTPLHPNSPSPLGAHLSLISSSQATKAYNDLSSYENALTKEAAWSTATSVLATAIPSDVAEQYQLDPQGYLQSAATATATPSWFTAMPTPVQQFISSVVKAENSILSKDANGPAPTNGVNVKLAGAALAAGGAVMAML